MKYKMRKTGFTMVEIIAVLVIIGIMAAVAAPKFINMGAQAKQKAAIAGVSEAMASLSVAYTKEYLDQNGATANITMLNILDKTSTGLGTGDSLDFGDIEVTFTVAGNDVTLTVTDYQGEAVTLDASANKVWSMPTQN